MKKQTFEFQLMRLETFFESKYQKVEKDGLWKILHMVSEPTMTRFVDGYLKSFKNLPRKKDFLNTGRWMRDNGRETTRDNLAILEGTAPDSTSGTVDVAELTDFELTEANIIKPKPTDTCCYCLNDGYFSTYMKGKEEQGPFTFLCTCEMGRYFAWMQWKNYLTAGKDEKSPSKLFMKQWGTAGCEGYHNPDVHDVSKQDKIDPESYENPLIRGIARRVKSNFDTNRIEGNQKELNTLVAAFLPGVSSFKTKTQTNSFDDDLPF